MTAVIAILIAQLTVLMPIPNTRQLQEVDYIIIAPNVYAVPDNAKGQAAYDQCMTTVNDSVACAAAKSKAITDDAAARFIAAQIQLYDGKDANGNPVTGDQLYTQYGLYIVRPTK